MDGGERIFFYFVFLPKFLSVAAISVVLWCPIRSFVLCWLVYLFRVVVSCFFLSFSCVSAVREYQKTDCDWVSEGFEASMPVDSMCRNPGVPCHWAILWAILSLVNARGSSFHFESLNACQSLCWTLCCAGCMLFSRNQSARCWGGNTGGSRISVREFLQADG